MTTILILSVVGISALLAEIVLPGGILGTIGGLCLVGAVVATYLEYGPVAGGVAFFLLLAVGVAALAVWMRMFDRLPLLKKLVLRDSIATPTAATPQETLVGSCGLALTDLVPSGRADIAGTKRDVVSEGPAVAKGDAVVVVAERGPSLVVRKAETP